MGNKQLNVWIPEDLRAYVARRANEEKCPMNTIISDLIKQDIARRNEHFVAQTTLTMIQEMVAIEIHIAHVQLLHDLRADHQRDAETFFPRDGR